MAEVKRWMRDHCTWTGAKSFNRGKVKRGNVRIQWRAKKNIIAGGRGVSVKRNKDFIHGREESTKS